MYHLGGRFVPCIRSQPFGALKQLSFAWFREKSACGFHMSISHSNELTSSPFLNCAKRNQKEKGTLGSK